MAIKMVVSENRKDWLDLRRKHIGGSDIAPIMLDRKFRPSWMKTPVELWLDKTGRVPEIKDNAAMRRGRAMEEPTAQRYAEINGFKVHTCPTLIDGYFAANIDRIVSMPEAPAISKDGTKVICKRLLECKTASHAWGEAAPMYYYGQPQWYMGFIPECESADIACWFDTMVKNIKSDEGYTDFAVYNHPRNDEFIKEAREKATEFMEKYVIPDVMPPVESESEARIKWAVSQDGLSPVVATAEIEKAVAEIHRIDEEKKSLAEKKDLLITEVMKAMGENPQLKTVDGHLLVSWKSQKSRRKIDWHGLALKYCIPKKEWIEEFTKVADKGSRPFKLI